MATITETTDFGIRRVGMEDKAAVAATAAAGFFDDPVMIWLLPEAERRRQLSKPAFDLYADAYIRGGEVELTADGNGTALLLPPNIQLLTPEQEVEFEAAVHRVLGDAAGRLLQLEETFAMYHPSEPVYYLQILATVPAFQGRGIGSAFLRRLTARAYREEMPAYHEATTPRNRALYERHGYVNVGELALPDGGPTLWRMWREPR